MNNINNAPVTCKHIVITTFPSLSRLQSRFKANFDNAPPATFMIVSKMNGKVLDIKKCKTTPGTKIIMYDRKFDNNANQLWYIDSKGFIKSFVGQMTMFAESKFQRIQFLCE